MDDHRLECKKISIKVESDGQRIIADGQAVLLPVFDADSIVPDIDNIKLPALEVNRQ